MADIVIFGDSKYPSLRHEVPLPLPDPIAYLEAGGVRTIVAGSLDLPRMRALGGYEVLSFEELGLAEALAQGRTLADGMRACVVEACRRLDVAEALVPSDFPVELADDLRSAGVAIQAEGALFEQRRRAKTGPELDGVRRAQRAAEAAMEHVRARLHEGRDLRVEELRVEAQRIFVDNRCVPHDLLVIAPAGQGADPHDQGSGPIPPGVPIVVDIFPRDMASGCWGDITRTYCVGDPPAELVEWHRAVREAQQQATAAVRAGIGAGELNRIACDVIRDAGYPTRLDEGAPEVLTEGFVHYLGHGVGLELHEAPTLDEGGEVLVPGDVITIEPGLYRPGFGGCRIEDVVVVTDDGYELITDFPYDLTP
jgi:Xaa-Pro aminopeptidase